MVPAVCDVLNDVRILKGGMRPRAVPRGRDRYTARGGTGGMPSVNSSPPPILFTQNRHLRKAFSRVWRWFPQVGTDLPLAVPDVMGTREGRESKCRGRE